MTTSTNVTAEKFYDWLNGNHNPDPERVELGHGGFLHPVVEMTRLDDTLWDYWSEPNLLNLLQTSNALAGEAGEVANVVKKMLRDGDSIELRQKMKEELIDVLIYLAKMIVVGEIDFGREYDRKHRLLHKRHAQRERTPVDEGHFASTRPLGNVSAY